MGSSRGRWHSLWICVALLLALFSASARASTVDLRGRLAGDANAVVTMKVVKRRGTPREVKRVVVRRVDHQCADGSTRELTVRLRRSRIDRVGITAKYTFFELLSPPSGLPAPDDRNQLVVTGKLRRSAARVTGTIDSTVRFAPVPPAIANACISVSRNYTVRRAASR